MKGICRRMNKEVKRQSNIELLRIVAMLGVIVLHFNNGLALRDISDTSINKYVIFFFESISICAVDLFLLISGYFAVTSKIRSIIRVLELLFQVMAFVQFKYFARIVFGYESFSMKSFVINFIPSNYFVTLYVSVYLLSLFLYGSFSSFSNKQWRKFIIVTLCIFSVWYTFADVTSLIFSHEWTGLSTVGIYGSMNGMNFVNFMMMYTLGAYLRINGFPKGLRTLRGSMVVWCVSVVIVFVWSLVEKRYSNNTIMSSWTYHNPCVILSAVSLFAVFSHFVINSNLVNKLATASFTCFLFHIKIMDHIYRKELLEENPIVLGGYIIISSVLIYLVSYVIHIIYHFFTDWLFALLEKKCNMIIQIEK